MKTAITVYTLGHWDLFDSYGLIACQLARHLSRLGVYVNALGVGETVMDSQPEDIRAITSQPIRASLGGLFLGYPTGYARHANPLAHLGPRIGITMFESSKIPQAWIAPLNALDAVIVPSTFCKEVFAACGVTTPIHVVPLGVGEVYQYAERDSDRPMTFLTFGDRGARKGGIVALKAFQLAFGEDTRYRLIFKMRKPKEGTGLTLLNGNIDAIQQDMTEQELYELYLQCDVLINPHKGEGFGLIPREFAATGGIALTTNWSGTADDLDQWGWPLPYSLERADWKGHRFEGMDMGEWASVDPQSCADALRKIAYNRDYCLEIAKHKAARVHELYSWQTFAEGVLAIWKEVAIGNSTRAATLAA